MDDRNEPPPSEPGDLRAQVAPESFDALASSLVWRIGRTSDEAMITVRVGLAGATAAFAELPRLHAASDAELREAIDAGTVRVEWVGPRSR